MKKSIVYLLLTLNLLLSFPVSFIGNVNANTLKSENEFFWLVIVCAFIILLFFGLIGWIVYKVLKKKNNPDATKYAMYTLTGLMVAGMIGSLPEFNTKFKQRRNMIQNHEFQKGFDVGCREQGKASLSQLAAEGIEVTDEKVSNFCSCVWEKIEMNSELKNQMMNGPMPIEEVQRDPKYLELVTDCMESLVK